MDWWFVCNSSNGLMVTLCMLFLWCLRLSSKNKCLLTHLLTYRSPERTRMTSVLFPNYYYCIYMYIEEQDNISPRGCVHVSRVWKRQYTQTLKPMSDLRYQASSMTALTVSGSEGSAQTTSDCSVAGRSCKTDKRSCLQHSILTIALNINRTGRPT